jgi:hypothetical protein
MEERKSEGTHHLDEAIIGTHRWVDIKDGVARNTPKR